MRRMNVPSNRFTNAPSAVRFPMPDGPGTIRRPQMARSPSTSSDATLAAVQEVLRHLWAVPGPDGDHAWHRALRAAQDRWGPDTGFAVLLALVPLIDALGNLQDAPRSAPGPTSRPWLAEAAELEEALIRLWVAVWQGQAQAIDTGLEQLMGVSADLDLVSAAMSGAVNLRYLSPTT
jgi:hypothetical protein